MKEITLKRLVGDFAENKDLAKEIRIKNILPSLEKREIVVLNFAGVGGATQSFIHALLSEAIRKHGADILDKIKFKNCNETIKKIITIVVEYMQESGF